VFAVEAGIKEPEESGPVSESQGLVD
jgi:hypothetical protein